MQPLGPGKRILAGTGLDALFVKPAWMPPAQLGVQAPYWGQGGPSGDFALKQGTIIPGAQLVGFCGMPVAQSWINIFAAPYGTPLTRPASPDTSYGKASFARPWTTIPGMMKAPPAKGS